MNLIIITGGSRGIGEALLKVYCKNNYHVINISRNKPSFIRENLLHVNFDLSKTDKFDILENIIISIVQSIKIASVTLINNAGTLGNITINQKDTFKNIDYTIRLNLIASLLLITIISKIFISKPIVIFNISSGAASNPYFGWVNYNASKSGLYLATKTIALEQKNNNFAIYNIIPGVVDTDMQLQIRNTTLSNFRDKDKFVQLKKNNFLVSPDKIALKIFSIATKDFISGSTIYLDNL